MNAEFVIPFKIIGILNLRKTDLAVFLAEHSKFWISLEQTARPKAVRPHTSLKHFKYKVTIHTLPPLKCIRLVSERSSHLSFKMH